MNNIVYYYNVNKVASLIMYIFSVTVPIQFSLAVGQRTTAKVDDWWYTL
jgi:hypothetical protein